MAEVKQQTSVVATLIGDVVKSRAAADRAALHADLTAALGDIASGAIDPPAFTVGDEFQGSYPTVGDAIDAAFSLRMAVAPDIDVRFGIGWGAVTVLDEHARIQDGPGWWAAREAIEQTASAQRRPGLALVRTTFRAGDNGSAENNKADNNRTDFRSDSDTINAALLCRDHLIGSLDGRSLRILKALMNGRTKKQIAAAEGISPSAVSQRTSRDGLDLLIHASLYLRNVR